MDNKATKKKIIIFMVIGGFLGIVFLMMSLFFKSQINAPDENKIEPFYLIPANILNTLYIIFLILSIPAFIVIPIGIAFFYYYFVKFAGKVTMASARAIVKLADAMAEKEEKEERVSNGDGTFAPRYLEIRIALNDVDTFYSSRSATARVSTSFDMSLNRKKVKIVAKIKFKPEIGAEQDEFDEFVRNTVESVCDNIDSCMQHKTLSSSKFYYTIRVKSTL